MISCELCYASVINSLSNDKNLDVTKLKAFADEKLDVAKMMISLFDRVEHCGKRRKCWLPAFSPFPTVLCKVSYLRSLCGLCGKELMLHCDIREILSVAGIFVFCP